MAKRKKSLSESTNETSGVRLNKYLSDSGVCSRRTADKYIEEGLVTVDGVVAVTGTKVESHQVVALKGKEIKREEKLVLIAFNKPRGIVCTTDKRDKDNIIDYIGYKSRIFPIGRLDKDSEGLILLTNDGDIVNKILRAGNNHEKEYIVTVNKPITAKFLEGMAAGVPILDTVTKPCIIKALDKTTFQIIITQGLNRQIRRMCEHFDYKVLSLKRIRIMNISIGHLQVGGYRNVTDKELLTLNELITDSSNAPIAADTDGREQRRTREKDTKFKKSTFSIVKKESGATNTKKSQKAKNFTGSKNLGAKKMEGKQTGSKHAGSKQAGTKQTGAKKAGAKNQAYKSQKERGKRHHT